VTVVVLARLAGRRPWDAALFALAPGLLLTATINWDLVAVLLTALAMLAWARRYPGLAGVLIGLGAATKLYPVLLLGALLLLCLRAGRPLEFVRTLLGAAVAWLVVNLPIMIVAPDGWKMFYAYSRSRGADFGSIWYALGLAGHPVPALNTVVTVLLVAAFAAIAVLVFAAPRRPRIGQVAFLLVVAFALLNKVYSPQYGLWLIPLAVLARPRWREFLIWQGCEALYFFAVWYYLAGGFDANRSLPSGPYEVAIFVHVAGTLYYTWYVVRDVLRPEHDPVRADGTDDPAGGVLDGAPDVLPLGGGSPPREPGRERYGADPAESQSRAGAE
jgi:uncharacterized membrane protein